MVAQQEPFNLNGTSTINVSPIGLRVGSGAVDAAVAGSGGGTGTLNISGDSNFNAENLVAGNNDGIGVVNQTGGTVSTNSWVSLGQGTNTGVGSGTYNHSGGTLDVNGDWFSDWRIQCWNVQRIRIQPS